MLRTRLLGFPILLLGIWGGMVPFIGPLFHFGAGTPAWTWTPGFGELQVAPAAVTVLGGLILVGWPKRHGRAGAWLAMLGGAWLILGPVFQPLWSGGSVTAGALPGKTWMQAFHVLGYHQGTGILIVLLGAFALGTWTKNRRRPRASVARQDAETAQMATQGAA